MRRLIALILLVLVPLHFSWAAMASYCQHETGPLATHLGHHSCKHEVAGLKDASGTTSLDDKAGRQGSQTGAQNSAQTDADCGMCHLGKAHLTELDFKLKPPMVGALLFATPIVNYTSFQPAALERPKWTDPL